MLARSNIYDPFDVRRNYFFFFIFCMESGVARFRVCGFSVSSGFDVLNRRGVLGQTLANQLRLQANSEQGRLD